MSNISNKLKNIVNEAYDFLADYKTVLISTAALLTTTSCIYYIDVQKSYNDALLNKKNAESKLKQADKQLENVKLEIKNIYDKSLKEEEIKVPKQSTIEKKVEPSKGSALEQKTK